MAEHQCNKEREVGEIYTLLKTLVKQVYGNGQEGLAKTVPQLSIKIDNLTETVAELRTSVSALVRFEAGYEGVQKDRFNTRQKTGIIVSGIVGFTAIIVTVILKFM
jgi:hypothetical protein